MRALFAIALVGCAAAKPEVRPSLRVIAKVLPTYGEVASAPECVRKIAEQRLSIAELGLSRRGTGTMPNLGAAWEKMHDTAGMFIPNDLQRGWDDPIPVRFELTTPTEAATDPRLVAVGLIVASRYTGATIEGTVPLHQLLCLAELPIVTRIDFNDQNNFQIDASPAVSRR